MDNDSRRASLRLPVNMKVKITTESYCTKHLVTENFSDGGIFVADDMLAEMQVGSNVEVQADEGMEGVPVIKARIAWTNSRGAGLEYLL